MPNEIYNLGAQSHVAISQKPYAIYTGGQYWNTFFTEAIKWWTKLLSFIKHPLQKCMVEE